MNQQKDIKLLYTGC